MIDLIYRTLALMVVALHWAAFKANAFIINTAVTVITAKPRSRKFFHCGQIEIRVDVVLLFITFVQNCRLSNS